MKPLAIVYSYKNKLIEGNILISFVVSSEACKTTDTNSCATIFWVKGIIKYIPFLLFERHFEQ